MIGGQVQELACGDGRPGAGRLAAMADPRCRLSPALAMLLILGISAGLWASVLTFISALIG